MVEEEEAPVSVGLWGAVEMPKGRERERETDRGNFHGDNQIIADDGDASCARPGPSLLRYAMH